MFEKIRKAVKSLSPEVKAEREREKSAEQRQKVKAVIDEMDETIATIGTKKAHSRFGREKRKSRIFLRRKRDFAARLLSI